MDTPVADAELIVLSELARLSHDPAWQPALWRMTLKQDLADFQHDFYRLRVVLREWWEALPKPARDMLIAYLVMGALILGEHWLKRLRALRAQTKQTDEQDEVLWQWI